MAAVATGERVFATDLKKQPGLPPALRGRLSADVVRRFVRLIGRSVDRLNREAGLDAEDAAAVRAGTLHEALLPLMYVREGRIADAASILAGSWGALAGRTAAADLPAVRFVPVDVTGEDATMLVALFNAAVTEELLVSSTGGRARLTIPRLMAALRLSYDDVGRMLGVSGETARRWTIGASAVPPEAAAKLDQARQGLSTLQRLILVDRLPTVIRRPAETFEGASALDWILQGRLGEVADRYERELSYQA